MASRKNGTSEKGTRHDRSVYFVRSCISSYRQPRVTEKHRNAELRMAGIFEDSQAQRRRIFQASILHKIV